MIVETAEALLVEGLTLAARTVSALDRLSRANPLYRIPRDRVLDRVFGPVEDIWDHAPLTQRPPS